MSEFEKEKSQCQKDFEDGLEKLKQPAELKIEQLHVGKVLYDSFRKMNLKMELRHFSELIISEKTFFDRYKNAK